MSQRMDRALLRVSGGDAAKFLRGLLTRDVPERGLGYAALLSPQGKYLADFLTFREDGAFWLDAPAALGVGLVQRLGLYRLRADVAVERTDRTVRRGTGAPPAGAMADPRPGMGWRLLDAEGDDGTDWDALRVEHIVPEAGRELVPGESYVLEMGFERLGGVDFRKGCYVGQEVTARMKHKTALRKGLARVRVEGDTVEGMEIDAHGRAVGVLHTRAGDRALAHLRFDRAEGELRAGTARVALDATA